MKLLSTLISLLKVITGVALVLFVLATIYLIALYGSRDMGTEAGGYFNVIVFGDALFGGILFVLFKVHKPIKEKINKAFK